MNLAWRMRLWRLRWWVVRRYGGPAQYRWDGEAQVYRPVRGGTADRG